MIRMFARHRVSDYPTWKRAYDAFDAERRGMGVRGHAVFQATDDPNDVTVWHDFDDVEAAKAFAGADRLREVMHEGGVDGEPEFWLTKVG